MDNEERLIGRARTGDGQALSGLAEQYAPQVYRLAFCLLKSEEEARDAAGDVFVKLYESPEKIPVQGFKPWLMKVVYNHCLDLLRRRKTWQGLLPRLLRYSQAGLEPDPAQAAADAEEQIIVRQALLKLPEKERAALVLRYYQDLSYDEISEVLGVAASLVGTWLHRGKARMKEILEQKG
ncbi:MAG: sigma-70 family RNA polymerase sigma factor [Syntrophomonas sp.]